MKDKQNKIIDSTFENWW